MSFYVSSQPVDTDLTAVAALSANGIVARTGTGTAEARTITGTANQVVVTDGDGVAGNPTLALPQSIHTAGTPQFARLGLGAAAGAAHLATLALGTVTVDTRGLSITATWNDAGVTFSGVIFVNVTSTASAAASLLIDLQVGGTSQFKVDKAGVGTFLGVVVTPNVRQTATRARLASAVTNVTTTLANLTELSLTLTAGRKYTGTLVLPVNQALAADGFKLDLGGGTATFTSIHFGFDSAIGATLGTRTSAAADTALTLTALADTSDVYITVQITMVVNAGGTFIPRQAKQADAAGGTLTLRAGGYLWLEDTP